TAPAREGITQKPGDDLGLSRSAYERQLAQRICPSVSVNHKRKQPEAPCSRRLRLQVSLIPDAGAFVIHRESSRGGWKLQRRRLASHAAGATFTRQVRSSAWGS